MKTISLDSKKIDELINRIVNAVHPIKIIMFGSAARDSLNQDSDIDVMVVVNNGTHCLDTTQVLYRQLFGFGFPVDILVTTPAIIERNKNHIGLIYRTVLAEGKEIYAA